MHQSVNLKRLSLLAGALLLAALIALAQQFRFFERVWFNAWQAQHSVAANALNLANYQVEIEARPIAGIDNVSALTYDPQRNSLFTVTNKNPQLIELSLDGQVLRKIDLIGFGDAEAVEYVGPNQFIISDEHRQRLIKVHINESTRQLASENAEQLELRIDANNNKGFEGLAYDAQGQRLFVAKERDPMRIYEISGFPQQHPSQPLAVHITDNEQRDDGLFVRDISSLQYHAASGHLLALSDESRLVLELDTQGKPVSSLSLLGGQQGLKHSVPQAEGMALDPQGTLYLTSEPNLFYVFRKKKAEQ